MALIGTRGLFSAKKKSSDDKKNKQGSVLASFAKNSPSIKIENDGIKNNNYINRNEKKIYKYDNDGNIIKRNYREEEKLEAARKNAYRIIYKKDEKDYNRRIRFLDSKTKNYKSDNRKKVNSNVLVSMVVVELLTLFLIFFIGLFIRTTNKVQEVPFNRKVVKNEKLDPEVIKMMEGFKTVAIFGLDSRTGNVGSGNNADVNMIANINYETGEVELVSLLRDMYLHVSDKRGYDKINSAYRLGGPELAVKCINENFDLNIQNYFSFNWKAVADGIDLLGGIDLTITFNEYELMNAFIHETCKATGIDAMNPSLHYIKSVGYQHLDGVQAVAYGRLRLTDSDFARAERQKKVVALCAEKVKKLSITQIIGIANVVLEQVSYDFDLKELQSIAQIANRINLKETTNVPEMGNYVTLIMGSAGDSVVMLNQEKEVIRLHKILYGDENYTPSRFIKAYNSKIRELRHQFEERNKAKKEAENNASDASDENQSELQNENQIVNDENTNNESETTVRRPRIQRETTSAIREELPENIEYEEEAENDVVIINVETTINNERSENVGTRDIPINDDNIAEPTASSIVTPTIVSGGPSGSSNDTGVSISENGPIAVNSPN